MVAGVRVVEVVDGGVVVAVDGSVDGVVVVVGGVTAGGVATVEDVVAGVGVG